VSDSGVGITYQWTTGDGNIVSGSTTTSPTIDQPGTYTIEVTNATNGCAASNNVVITENVTNPVADAGLTQTLDCNTSDLNLDGSSSSSGTEYTYQWTTLDGNITSGSTTLSPTVNQSGTYSIEVTNTDNGCTSTSDVVINSDSNAPIADAGTPLPPP